MRDEEDDEDLSELDVSDEQPSPTKDRAAGADDIDIRIHQKSSPPEHSKKLEPVDTNVSAS
jgi:hypothetical protein